VHGYKHRYHLGEGGTEKVEAAEFILESFGGLRCPGIVKSNPSGDGRARKTSSEGARFLVRKVLEQKGGSVLKTERILSISPEDPKKGKRRLV